MKFLKENINISAECLYFLFLGNQGQLFKKGKYIFTTVTILFLVNGLACTSQNFRRNFNAKNSEIKWDMYIFMNICIWFELKF